MMANVPVDCINTKSAMSKANGLKTAGFFMRETRPPEDGVSDGRACWALDISASSSVSTSASLPLSHVSDSLALSGSQGLYFGARQVSFLSNPRILKLIIHDSSGTSVWLPCHDQIGPL